MSSACEISYPRTELSTPIQSNGSDTPITVISKLNNISTGHDHQEQSSGVLETDGSIRLDGTTLDLVVVAAVAEEMNGRERLKRHSSEVAGRVWIPDIWGHEDLLKDWIDCSAFDSSLVPNGVVSARAALVREGRRASCSALHYRE